MKMMIQILYYLGDTWAVTAFCGKNLRISPKRQVLFGGIFIALKWITMTAMAGQVARRFSIIFTLCEYLFLIGLIMLFSGEDREKKLFAAALIIAGRRFVWNFCDSFLSTLIIVFLHMVKKEATPVIGIESVDSFVISICTYGAGILFICLLSGYGKFLFTDKSKKWFLNAAIPLFLLTLVVDLSNWGAEHGILLRGGGNLNLYYDQLFSYIGNCILAALCMFSAAFYVLGMEKVDTERRKKEIYLARIESYKMLEEQHEQTKKFRHDHKNHMLALNGLMENKEYDKAGDYIKQMIKAGNFDKGEVFTGNSAVDALLFRKQKEAQDKDILWECDVALSGECNINEYDLCVVFGNLLDNAIEACGQCRDKGKFIKIHSFVVKKCLILEIENSTENTTIVKAGSVKKDDSRDHGIGLFNVKDVVSKYNGVMDVKAEENTFMISILFPLAK